MNTDKKTIAILIAVSVVLLGGIVLTAKKNALPTQNTGPGGSLFGSSIRTLPTSRHVTGMPYPKQCTLGAHGLPDHSCTPGAADGEVLAPSLGNPGNLKGTICTPGWTSEARALDGELVPVMTAAAAAYNERGQAVLVWLVPLSLGGSNDASNMFPIPVAASSDDANAKATTDATVNKAVCAGTIGLAAAQQAMATNWTTALQQLGLT
jgi:hypothetical protein